MLQRVAYGGSGTVQWLQGPPSCSSSSFMLVVDLDYHRAWLFDADAKASKPVLLSHKFYPWDYVYLEKDRQVRLLTSSSRQNGLNYQDWYSVEPTTGILKPLCIFKYSSQKFASTQDLRCRSAHLVLGTLNAQKIVVMDDEILEEISTINLPRLSKDVPLDIETQTMAWSVDGSMLAFLLQEETLTPSATPQVCIYDSASGQHLQTFELPVHVIIGPCAHIVWSRSLSLLAVIYPLESQDEIGMDTRTCCRILDPSLGKVSDALPGASWDYYLGALPWLQPMPSCWSSCGNLLVLPGQGGVDAMDPNSFKVVHHFTGCPDLSWVQLPTRTALQTQKQEKTLAACDRSENILLNFTLQGKQWRVKNVDLYLSLSCLKHVHLARTGTVLVGDSEGLAGTVDIHHFVAPAFLAHYTGHCTPLQAAGCYSMKWSSFSKGMAAASCISGVGSSCFLSNGSTQDPF